MRKDTSTNAMNEKQLLDSCGMAYALNIIGGRWKPAIICRLLYKSQRYGELKKSIAGISERMLVAQLRELEKDGIIERSIYAEVPPRVEYRLTTLGKTMKPMMKSMSDWGNMHREKTTPVQAVSAALD